MRSQTPIPPLLLTALLLTACGGAPMPELPPLQQWEARAPVILVPGITGVKLRDRETGKVVWGNGASLVVPHDGGYALALPIPNQGPESTPADSRLEPFEVIEEISLLGIKKPIYGPIRRLLEANGYTPGDLDDPRPGQDYFPFVYDWRRDKTESAALLADKLQALRRARGDQRLPVVLICQSCGAHICRWLAKYGGASLEEAEAGRGAPPPGIEIAKVILVGSSNGGSMRILRELHRGRRYVTFGRRWSPEVLFTFPSLFQDLPAYRSDLFLGDDGEAVELDLYDPTTWEDHGWSIFSPRSRKRLVSRPRPELFSDEAAQRAHLARVLGRARRFQRLLHEDAPGFGATRYYSIQATDTPTPDRAVLLEGKRGLELFFTGDKALRRRARLHDLATALGDEHAPLASQDWLSPQESSALAATPFYVGGGHFELILDPATRQRLLEYLLDGAGDPGGQGPRLHIEDHRQ